MLEQPQMKQGPKLSFFTTGQRISAIKAQALPNQWRFEPPKPPLPTPLEMVIGPYTPSTSYNFVTQGFVLSRFSAIIDLDFKLLIKNEEAPNIKGTNKRLATAFYFTEKVVQS